MDISQQLNNWIRSFKSVDLQKNAAELDEYFAQYPEIKDREQRRGIAIMLADACYKQAEACANALSIYESLNCVIRCRMLADDFPGERYIAGQLLQVITGLLYVKLQHHEDGMVEDYMDEVLEIAERFPTVSDIQQQAAMCMGNLIAMCGSFDAPLSLAYNGAERMETVAQRLPNDSGLQNIYAHILVSVLYFADRTNNTKQLNVFSEKLRAVRSRGIIDVRSLQQHLSHVNLSV